MCDLVLIMSEIGKKCCDLPRIEEEKTTSAGFETAVCFLSLPLLIMSLIRSELTRDRLVFLIWQIRQCKCGPNNLNHTLP